VPQRVFNSYIKISPRHHSYVLGSHRAQSCRGLIPCPAYGSNVAGRRGGALYGLQR
jgi:hypothetical protein